MQNRKYKYIVLIGDAKAKRDFIRQLQESDLSKDNAKSMVEADFFCYQDEQTSYIIYDTSRDRFDLMSDLALKKARVIVLVGASKSQEEAFSKKYGKPIVTYDSTQQTAGECLRAAVEKSLLKTARDPKQDEEEKIENLHKKL